MSSPLGVSPTVIPEYSSPARSFPLGFRHRHFKKASRSVAPAEQHLNSSTSAVPQRGSSSKHKFTRKHKKSLSNRAFLAEKRTKVDSGTRTPTSEGSLHADNSICSTTSACTSADSLGFPRSKHTAITIPDYELLDPSNSGSRSGSFSNWLSNKSDILSAADFLASLDNKSSRPRAKHVEIQIPDYASPALRVSHANRQSRRRNSTFALLEESATAQSGEALKDLDNSSYESIMEPLRSVPEQAMTNSANGGTSTYLANLNSSSTSLASQGHDEESASEAESTQHEEGSRRHAPSQSTGRAQGAEAQAQNTPSSNPSNLSGLVCNVHRTTGKEPHPLVGATTTILGDKLYVFGGRRLSRSKPQLTSNLYELDLIKRHWTKLDVTGDIPQPRYFHSMCALGDTKLVCYGGMSPSQHSADASADSQPEVIVMSDVHIYDVSTKAWTRINTPDAPQGRYAHCAAILPSSAVFASATAPLSAVHHNPSGSNPNQGSIGVSLDGSGGAELVVVGGQDSANHYIEQISVFNLRSLKWTGTTGMGRSCGAYRSVVTPLTSMSASQIGGGPHATNDMDEDEDERPAIGSGCPMLIYSNYNFLDVKLELQIRLVDGTLTEKPMQTAVSPPGLRFPNGGVISNHFVVSGTFLTSSKQEYALWALDLRALTWSRIDAGGSIFSQGSWNRGVLWSRRNCFVILGNRKRSLVDDYNNRRINFTNICLVELEAFGLYDNPRRAAPTSAYMSASASPLSAEIEVSAGGRTMSRAAEDLGEVTLSVREFADMEFLAIDGTRIPVNSRIVTRRWGSHFTNLLRESLALSAENDTATLHPSTVGHPSRNSSITITPSVTSGTTTLTVNSVAEAVDAKSVPPATRPRLFYLPHTGPTLQALVHYLYTSTLPCHPHALATPQIFCSLLQLARPYKIDGLLEAVVERLHDFLDGRNAAAIFNAAAMGAGGGEGVQFSSSAISVRDSAIPIRATSLPALDGLVMNGGGSRGASVLRIDTEMANGRSTRNTIRPGQPLAADDSEDDAPDSAATDASMSDFEGGVAGFPGRGVKDEIWNGSMSAVVGLQKRGLRGLMEGRRLRERGKSDQEPRVGLGIA